MTRHLLPRAGWPAVLVAAAVALAGCGVGAQRSPVALDRRSIPYGLLGHRAHRQTSAPNFESTRVTLWLVGGDQQLVPVRAYVAWPATIGGLLNALVQGPTEPQSQRGLVSPASAVGPISSGPPRHGIVPVDLPASFENLGGSDQLLAAAQIVYTLTGFPGIRGVVFKVVGERANVPNAKGKLVAGPLTRAAYSSLAH